ncbi:MAG: hypothetical protein EOP05_06685, partial [Proteobacteria bacterium]
MLVSNGCAYAVLQRNGSVETWGNARCADSSQVASEISANVVSVFGEGGRFAATKADGSVILWPKSPEQAADLKLTEALSSRKVKSVTMGVRHITVLKTDGSVYVWRLPLAESGIVPEDQLKSGVKTVVSNGVALAALKDDGSVVAFGYASAGGDASKVADKLKSGVVTVKPTSLGFIALKSDGSAVLWGNWQHSSELPEVVNALSSGVVDIFAAESNGFAALKKDGSVFSWEVSYDGTIPKTIVHIQPAPSSDVVRVFSNDWSFAALMADGSVKTWTARESADFGGDSSSVSQQLKSDVVDIIPGVRSYVAIKKDGSVVPWGAYGTEGFTDVAPKMTSPVASVYSGDDRFVAHLTDGRSFLWGSSVYAGAARELPIGTYLVSSNYGSIVGVDGNGNVFGSGDERYGSDPYCDAIPAYIKL